MKWEKYIEYKFLSIGINKYFKLLIYIGLILGVLLLPIFINDTLISRIVQFGYLKNINSIMKSVCVSFFILSILFSINTFQNFKSADEYLFLRSFPIRNSEFVLIICTRLFFAFYTYSIVISGTAPLFDSDKLTDAVYRGFYFLYVIIIMFCFSLFINILIKRYRKIFFILSVVLLISVVAYILLIPKDNIGITGSNIKDFIFLIIIQAGNSPLYSILYAIFFNCSFNLFIVAGITIILLFMLVAFNKKILPEFLEPQENSINVRRKKVNSISKYFNSPLTANFYKDISGVKGNVGYLMLQVIFLIVFATLFIYGNDNIWLLAFVCYPCCFFNTLVCHDLFQIDIEAVELYKSFPIETTDFLVYKSFTNFVLSIILPILYIILNIITGRMYILHLFLLLIFILVVTALLSLAWSVIVLITFPKLETSIVPLTFAVCVTLFIPILSILIIVIFGGKALSKWKNMEV